LIKRKAEAARSTPTGIRQTGIEGVLCLQFRGGLCQSELAAAARPKEKRKRPVHWALKQKKSLST